MMEAYFSKQDACHWQIMHRVHSSRISAFNRAAPNNGLLRLSVCSGGNKKVKDLRSWIIIRAEAENRSTASYYRSQDILPYNSRDTVAVVVVGAISISLSAKGSPYMYRLSNLSCCIGIYKQYQNTVS